MNETDFIDIEGLVVRTIIGIFDEERERRQDVVLSLRLFGDFRPAARSDHIDDAIDYAIERGRVDLDNIVMVGRSGGGYATMGMYLASRHKLKLALSWVGVSDLVAWYHQSRTRAPRYRDFIARCTAEDGVFDETKARARSPLYFEAPTSPNGRIEIFHGIEDGFGGATIPASHSIRFYNRVVEAFGAVEARVPEADAIALLTKSVPAETSDRLGDRRLFYRRGTEFAELFIFDGAHEMLDDVCFERIEAGVSP